MGGLFVFITLASHLYGLNSIKSKTVGHGQHGTARWASKREIKDTYTKVPYEPSKWREDPKSRPKEQGIVVGCETVGNDTVGLVDTGDVHCMMIGAAGVGKTAFWLYPNIEYACASGMSFMSTDTKGDIMRNYGSIASKYYGYNISVIDLRNPMRSHGNNLLHLVNKYMDLYAEHPETIAYKAKAEKYAKIISKTIILSGMDAGSFGQNAYFYDAAEGVLTASILLVSELCKPEERHIVSVFKIIQELLAPSNNKQQKNQFNSLMAKLPDDHKAKWFAGAALNTSEQSMASVMSTALSRLNAFLDSELETILCNDTEIDAEKFCSEKSAIFIIMPEEDSSKYFMVSLIIQQDILSNVDLQYIINSGNIKENLIVKKRQDAYSYTFTVKLNNLDAKLNENGSVSIFDPNTEEVIYFIPAPIVHDANGEYADSSCSMYSLEAIGNNTYALTVDVDSAWMNADDRAFPVTIDPPIYIPSGSTVTDTYINSYSVNSDPYDFEYMYAGNTTQLYWKTSALPALPNDAYITNADFSLRILAVPEGTYDSYMGAFQVTTNWDVVIRFDYQNNQYETVEIDGKAEKIYVPFAMLTGMLLNTDTFTNVEVSNGKLINDGDRMAVVGIAFPGLQSNLAVDKEKFELPEYVEISADVKNFEMTMSMTIATNDLFNQINPDELNSIDSLTDSLDDLTDAMSQLMDGSSQLYDGLCTLLEKSNELVAGIDKLAAGAKALKDGAGDLDAGAAKLQDGAAALYAGLNTLSSNNDVLNGGAKQVFETLLSTTNTQIAAAGLNVPTLTIDNYAEVLNGVIASLDENAVYEAALSKVTAAVEENRPLIESKVTEAVKEQVTAEVTATVQAKVTEQVTAAVRETVADQVIPVATNNQMTKETYDAAVAAGMIDANTQASIEAAIDAQMSSDSIKQTIEQNVSAQMASEAIQNTISSNVAEQMQTQAVKDTIAENIELQVNQAISENMASDAVQDQLKAASDGAKAVTSLKTSLDNYNSFYLGLLAYTNGVADAAAGAGQLKSGTDDLKDGTSKLYSGVNELYDGILQIKNGAPALINGVTELRDGSMKLSDGLKEFNEKGVQKLVDAVDGDLRGLITRVRATVDVSKNYKSFSGLSDEMDGQVKFIYRTEAVKIAK